MENIKTERLREIVEHRSPSLRWGEAEKIAAELLANREAQPVAGELGEICVGRLPTMNQEEYPGLGDWWVQLRIGANHDEILARVYGATPEEAVTRARALTAPPAPAVVNLPTEFYSDEGIVIQLEKVMAALAIVGVRFKRNVDACCAAMLAQPVSQGYKLNSPEIPDGWRLVPIDATRAMIEAAQMVEEDGYDAMHKAMLAAAPEGGNDA